MASKYDTTSIKTFDNEVLREALESALITKLDMNNYITVDYSLAAEPGMKIKVHTYVGKGDVEDLAMGAGNSGDIGSEWKEAEYEVITTQGRAVYYDEQQMNDPKAIDAAVNHLAEQLTNDITSKVVAELDNASLTKFDFKYDFDDVVDAISMLPEEVNDGMFLMIARKDLGKFQKKCKELLSYSEDYVRTGIVGHLAGVPVVPTDAVAVGKAYLASREAITCFVKKGVELETERDANTRANKLFGRNVKVIALTNAKKVVKLTVEPEPTDGEGQH